MYTKSTISSFLQPGLKRVLYQYPQAPPDVRGESFSLMGQIFSVVSQGVDAATGAYTVFLQVAPDPAGADLTKPVDLPTGTLINVNGSWMFTATGPVVTQSIPPANVATVAAGVICAISGLLVIYIQVLEVDEATNPAQDLVNTVIQTPGSSLLVLAVLALIGFIVWKTL